MGQQPRTDDTGEVPTQPVDADAETEGGSGWSTSSSRGVVGKNIVVLLGSQGVTWSLAVVLTVIEPRFLGPEGVGQLRVATAVWSIANILVELGTSTLLTLEFARDPRAARRLLRPVFRAWAAAEVIATIAVLGFVVVAGYDFDTSVTAMIIGISLAVAMFGEMARAALYGMQLMGPTAVTDIISKVVLVVVVVVTLVVLGGNVQALAVASIIPASVMTILLWRSLRARLPTDPPEPPASMRDVVTRSSPFLFGSAIQVIYGSLDAVVISLVASVEEVGWYAAAATLFGSLLFLPSTFATTLFPAIAQMHEERPESVPYFLGRSVRSMLLVAVPIGLGTVVVADQTCRIILGEEFVNSGPVLAAYGVVLIIMFQNILFGRFAFATGRHHVFNVLMLIACVLTVPLDLFFVPWTRDRFDNGAIGGALTYIATEGIILVFSVWKLAPEILDRALFVRLLKVGAAGAALMGASWPLRDRFLPIPVLAGAIAYLAVVILLRVMDDDERHMAARFWFKLMNRVRPNRSLGAESPS